MGSFFTSRDAGRQALRHVTKKEVTCQHKHWLEGRFYLQRVNNTRVYS
jgi:hypothetical protein